MKKILTLLGSVLLLASCSAPKYSYYFDHYDYNSGKKSIAATPLPSSGSEPSADVSISLERSPLLIEEEATVASVESTAIVPVKPAAAAAPVKKYTEMSRAEKKEFRKELKTEIRKYAKAKKSGEAIAETKVMDYNLKMAIIFGAVALTLSFFGGVNSVFWVASVVALVIGVVFFIKWIAEQ